tara:strand:+ start:383 stop:772 length:390 start_codon:yes stop_codon:yes gene_type:complete
MATNNIRRTRRPTATQRRRLSNLSIDANEEAKRRRDRKRQSTESKFKQERRKRLLREQNFKDLSSKAAKTGRVRRYASMAMRGLRRAGQFGLAISAGEAIGNQLKKSKIRPTSGRGAGRASFKRKKKRS